MTNVECRMSNGSSSLVTRHSTFVIPFGSLEVRVAADDLKTKISEATEGGRGEVRRDEPMSRHTSMRVGGPADAMIFPRDLADLVLLWTRAVRLGVPITILGGGANTLVRDGGIRGIVVRLSRWNRIEPRPPDGIWAEAGVTLEKAVKTAANLSLSGFEWAAGIPGTIGGAVVMNAGTREGEMKDVIASIDMILPTGEPLRLPRERIAFSYRASRLPEGWVAAAELRLRPAPRASIDEQIKMFVDRRRDTQPLSQSNSGSIFKNPPGDFAARLIERAGLKGAARGGARISEKHANFIVNTGNARAADVIALIGQAQTEVEAKFGVRLEPEVRIIGNEEGEDGAAHD